MLSLCSRETLVEQAICHLNCQFPALLDSLSLSQSSSNFITVVQLFLASNQLLRQSNSSIFTRSSYQLSKMQLLAVLAAIGGVAVVKAQGELPSLDSFFGRETLGYFGIDRALRCLSPAKIADQFCRIQRHCDVGRRCPGHRSCNLHFDRVRDFRSHDPQLCRYCHRLPGSFHSSRDCDHSRLYDYLSSDVVLHSYNLDHDDGAIFHFWLFQLSVNNDNNSSDKPLLDNYFYQQLLVCLCYDCDAKLVPQQLLRIDIQQVQRGSQLFVTLTNGAHHI